MVKALIYRLLSRYLLKGCSDYNTLKVRRSTRSKNQAKQAFLALNIPSARSCLFYLPFAAFAFVKHFGFPVVIKPNVGGFSRGAYFPIENYWQLCKASILVKAWWLSSVVEQYLSGNNYRIVVIKNDIMAIARRHPPFVVGNGVDSICTLIDKENSMRTAMGLQPIVANIAKNRPTLNHLKKQRLSLASIPPLEKKVNLHHKISLKLGGVIEAIPKSQLSENNHQTLLSILEYFGANILGIDLICQQDLSVDFDQQNCIFLEVNSRPFLQMHALPRLGKKEDLSTYYRQLDQYQTTAQTTF